MDPPQKQQQQAYGGQPAPQGYAQQQQYAQPPQGYAPQQQQGGPYPAGSPYMQPTMGAPPPGQQQYVYQTQYQPTYVAAAPGVIPVAPMVGPAGQTVVVVEQQTYFGSQPAQCVCPNCRNNVVTNVVYTPGALSWLCCVGLCIVGLWPCAPIPFCLTGMQDANHYCPACGVLIRRRDALD